MGLDFQVRLLSVNLTAVDKDTEKEVDMFLIAIAKNPPTMNLDGYANINRELITTVMCYLPLGYPCDLIDLRNFSECVIHGNIFGCFATIQIDAAEAKCKEIFTTRYVEQSQ